MLVSGSQINSFSFVCGFASCKSYSQKSVHLPSTEFRYFADLCSSFVAAPNFLKYKLTSKKKKFQLKSIPCTTAHFAHAVNPSHYVEEIDSKFENFWRKVQFEDTVDLFHKIFDIRCNIPIQIYVPTISRRVWYASRNL